MPFFIFIKQLRDVNSDLREVRIASFKLRILRKKSEMQNVNIEFKEKKSELQYVNFLNYFIYLFNSNVNFFFFFFNCL